MTVNATELVQKVNMVKTARRMKEKGYIEDYPILPSSSEEEKEVVRNLVQAFLKKLFVGSKIRPNAHSFSLRLDGHIHRKANKIREIYNNEQEWRTFFENNHSNLYRRMRENRSAFQTQSNLAERRERDGHVFLYVPFAPERIYGYVNHGLMEFFVWYENEHQKDQRLATIYDEVMNLMEEEIARKKREREERIARELAEYNAKVARSIFKPVAPLQESEDAVDRLFASKFSEWAAAHSFAPEYAVDITAHEMVPTDLRVKILAPPGSEEEGWLALPPFEGYQEPEGYEFQGWGKVSDIDTTGERSRGGAAPIVIQKYMYTEFHAEHWMHLVPQSHAEILEATKRIRREAEAEVAPWLEQERIREEKEAVLAAERAEQERIQREQERLAFEADIRRQVAEREANEARQRARLEQERELIERAREEHAEESRTEESDDEAVEMTDAMRRFIEQARLSTDVPHVPDTVISPATGDRATSEGLYLNNQAIPLERYVAIRPNGDTRRFRQIEDAAAFMGYSGDLSLNIRNYHAPHTVIETANIEI